MNLLSSVFPSDALAKAVKAFFVGCIGAVTHAHLQSGDVLEYLASDWKLILGAGVALAVGQLGLSVGANGLGSDPDSSSFAGVLTNGDDTDAS